MSAVRKRPRGTGRRGPVPGAGGRRKIELTKDQLQQVQRLAEIGATHEEMATHLGVSLSTFHRRLSDETSDVYERVRKGEAALRVALRRKQVAIALNDDHANQSTMLIWCGKVILGQSERMNVRIETADEAEAVLRKLFPELSDEHVQALTGDAEVGDS